MRSKTLSLYATWLATATPEAIAFVDEVLALCELNYNAGGDHIVECYGPADIVERFESIDDVRAVVRRCIEQELNARWGEDSDPELERARAEWKELAA